MPVWLGLMALRNPNDLGYRCARLCALLAPNLRSFIMPNSSFSSSVSAQDGSEAEWTSRQGRELQFDDEKQVGASAATVQLPTDHGMTMTMAVQSSLMKCSDT